MPRAQRTVRRGVAAVVIGLIAPMAHATSALADDPIPSSPTLPSDSSFAVVLLDGTAAGCTFTANMGEQDPDHMVPPGSYAIAYASSKVACSGVHTVSVSTRVRPVYCGNGAAAAACINFTTNGPTKSDDNVARAYRSGWYDDGWYRALGGYDMYFQSDVPASSLPSTCSEPDAPANKRHVHCYTLSVDAERVIPAVISGP